MQDSPKKHETTHRTKPHFHQFFQPTPPYTPKIGNQLMAIGYGLFEMSD
jgi:hypothetical protein